MKVFQTTFSTDITTLIPFLEKMQNRLRKHPSVLLFRVYLANTLETQIGTEILNLLNKFFRKEEFLAVGCTSKGNIYEGMNTNSNLLSVEFWSKKTKMVLYSYSFNELSLNEIANNIKQKMIKKNWIKSLEFFSTYINKTKGFCQILSKSPLDVEIYGGIAYNNFGKDKSFVFSSVSGVLEEGIIFLAIGGKDYTVKTVEITEGWRRIGSIPSIITDCTEGGLLRKIDDLPAVKKCKEFEINTKTLEDFQESVRGIPLLFEDKGITILRTMKGFKNDAVQLTAEIPNGTEVYFAYLDFLRYFKNLKKICNEIKENPPTIINIITCPTKAVIMQDKSSIEIISMNKLAYTSGYNGHGEFVRVNGKVIHTNVTTVFICQSDSYKRKKAKVRFTELERYIDGAENKFSYADNILRYLAVVCNKYANTMKEIEKMAKTDVLTNIHNRKCMSDKIEEMLLNQKEITEIYFDADGFKVINDTYGHEAGDAVLVQIGKILSAVTEKYNGVDVARWGGDEFIVLLEGIDKTKALEVARFIENRYKNYKFVFGGNEIIGKTLSMGIAYSEIGDDENSLTDKADRAMYYVKKHCKGQIAEYNPEIHTEAKP